MMLRVWEVSVARIEWAGMLRVWERCRVIGEAARVGAVQSGR